MSNKAKYVCMAALFTAVAVCAFWGAYKVFNTEPKIKVSEASYGDSDAGYARETTPEYAEKEEAAEEAAEASVVADKINEDTLIVYEYFYVDEGKTERAEQKAPYALRGLTREQLMSRIEGFSVVSFSPAEVVLRKRISGSNSSRYILGIWEGRVAVFYGGSGLSQNGLKEITDTPVSSLSQEEQERLKDGMTIEGDEALMKVLEDYGS